FDDILVTRLGDQSCYVGANDQVTYTLTISNQGRIPAYDLVITDVLPAGMSLVTYTMQSDDPTAQVVAEPSPIPGATGVLTWAVNHLTPTIPYTWARHTAITLNVVLQVADGITANTVLSDQAFLAYSSQPGGGPVGVERAYSGGSHSAAVQTVNGGISKTVTFSPPPTATLGTLVTYTLIVPATPITATLYNVVVTDTIDSRMQIVAVTASGGTGWSWGWSGQVVTATFAAIPHDTQAYVTITARISHEWPSAAGDANAGDILTDVAQMSHATAPVTASNTVSTTVGEPHLLVEKSAESSTGSLSDLDGTALLTYTIRLTNTGSSPAYSVYITDAVPAGISVTALYGGDGRSGPVVGPGVLTWTVGYISNTPPANVVLLTYTARISQALVNARLTNTVDVLYHSLTETIPGVRPYTNTDQAAVETASPQVSKSTEPFVLRVGDIVTYSIVFTIPAGTVWLGNTLLDGLSPGLWYITDSETLTWTPSTVNVTITGRVSNTTEAPGHQIIRWTFAPITSEQDIPTVVTLTFQAQAVGLRIDTLEPVWITQTDRFWPGNYVQLEFPWPNVVTDVVTNMLIQPYLQIAKSSTPPPGAYVGAGDHITYTLTVTNSGYGLAYDIVLSDVLPVELFYVTSTITSTTPPYIAFLSEPPVGATGVLTWRVNELWGLEWTPWGVPKVATVTVVAQVTDTVGANLRLTNTAAIPYYDSQPGDGPGPYPPDEREYTDGSDSVFHRTVDAAILKSVTPPTATLGDVVTYVVVVPATPITATLYNVTVTDSLDPRLQLHTVTAGPDGTVATAGNAFTVTYPAIPHGEQRFITVTAVLSSPLGADAGDVITNLAVLAHRDGGPTPSNQPVFTVTEPALTLVKASDPSTSSTVRVGEPVTYTVRITNATGITTSPAYDIVFTDTLPVGMRTTPPALLAVTLNGAPVPATDYVTGYNAATGVFTVAFTPAFSIPVGGELVIQYRATVDSDVPAATDLANRAEVTWSSLPGPVPGDRAYGPITDTTTLHTPLATGLTKAVSPPTVTVGSQVVFSVTLPVPPIGAVLHNVLFTDVVDSRLRIDAVSPNASFSGQVVTATFATIPTYTQEVILITATVRDLITVTAGTQISNVAVFDYRDNPTGPISSNPVTVTVAEPQVTLDKSVQVPRDPLGAGDLVTYTLTLSNTGTWPAYDLVITDSLPAGLAFIATGGFTVTDPVTATLGGDYPAWTVSQLNGGGYVYITFTARVAADIGAGLVLTNAAWGRYDGQPGPNPDQREYPIPTDTVPVNTGYPTLDLEKSAEPSPVEAGGLLTYTLTVTNTGIVSATGVVVTDAVPASTAYVSCGPLPCGEAGGVVSWTLGVLDIGVPRVLTMQVQVTSPLPNGTILTNTAWVTSTEEITDTDTVTTPVASAPILHLVKSSTDADGAPLRPGDRITYTLVVSNSGNETALGVVVSDTVPVHTTYVPGSIAGGDGRDDTNVPLLVWTINSLPPNVPVYLTFAVTVNMPLTDGLQIVNTGAVTCTQIPTPTADTVTDTVVSSHTLEVSKSAEPSPVQAGGLLTYTIAYTITGDEPVYGVVVSDTVPEHTTFVTATLPHSRVGDTVLWPLGDFLSAGSGITQATGVLTLVVLVDSPLVSGTVIHNAVAITDTSGLTDTDEVTTPVQSAHALSVTKTASPSPVQAGDLLTYSLAWAVTGNEPAFGVTISDTVPVSTTYVACYPAGICSESGGVVTWSLGDQFPPASGVVTLVVRVNSPLVSGTVLYNAVAITDTSGLTDTDEVT
ncbi:MAG: isopeptide-forming domain-containing fimbrial protein, partial [Anaerolineae bacterium]